MLYKLRRSDTMFRVVILQDAIKQEHILIPNKGISRVGDDDLIYIL